MKPNDLLEHDGVEQPIIEWALDYGITPTIIISRLERGFTASEAITVPMQVAHVGQKLPIFHRKQRSPTVSRERKRRRIYTANGVTMPLGEWALMLGVSTSAIHRRIKEGWTVEEAITMPPKQRGVTSNFACSEGTGAGKSSQESPKITFSEKA